MLPMLCLMRQTDSKAWRTLHIRPAAASLCSSFQPNFADSFDNLQIARRITLQRLMPDAASVFKLCLTALEIQEPCFTDLVILYRKSKEVLDRPSSEKEPLPKYSKASAAFVSMQLCSRLRAFPDLGWSPLQSSVCLS